MNNKLNCLEKMGYEVNVTSHYVQITLRTESEVFSVGVDKVFFSEADYTVETLVKLINGEIQEYMMEE